MLDLLKNRRSIRKFKDTEVPKDVVDSILDGALTSPSGRRIRPWELLVVDDNEKLSQLGPSRGPASKPISNAPLAIVVIVDPKATDVWIEDASVISTITQLVAQSLGLGSCWIQVRNRLDTEEKPVEDGIKALLNIPDNYKVESMIALGYPDEEKSPHDVKELKKTKVHYNSF